MAKTELSTKERDLQSSRNSVRNLEAKKQELQKAKSDLIASVEGARLEDGQGLRSDPVKEEKTKENEEKIKGLKSKEETLYSRIEELQKRIQKESHRLVLERFGDGPFHVKFSLKMPDEEEEVFFIVETAPVDIMPHSVHVFLEQVKHGLWNRSKFTLNASHILQVSPLKKKLFREAELDSLSFQEYNKSFTHKKYTLGFTGRPAGPEWYINKVNNTQNHGPGGQAHHVLEEEAEPCFAKVVEGFETIDILGMQPTAGSNSVLKKSIQIVSAELLGKEYVPPQGAEK